MSKNQIPASEVKAGMMIMDGEKSREVLSVKAEGKYTTLIEARGEFIPKAIFRVRNFALLTVLA